MVLQTVARVYSRMFIRKCGASFFRQSVTVTTVQCRNLTITSVARQNVEDPNYHNPKDDILPEYANRNPRNLELLRIARKPQGYDLDASCGNHWYKLDYKQVGSHITGVVQHQSGRVVVSASTKEWSLLSRLPSTNNYTAAVTVGKLLARRCLEAGFIEVGTGLFPLAENSEKIRGFLESMVSGGVRLEEDFQLHETDTYPWAIEHPTMPWQVPEHIALEKYKELIPDNIRQDSGRDGTLTVNTSPNNSDNKEMT